MSTLANVFPVEAVAEMLREAREICIFPLLPLSGTPLAYVKDGMTAPEHRGWHAAIEPVAHEFQRGGEMLGLMRRARSGQR